jgi:hypothetical protein
MKANHSRIIWLLDITVLGQMAFDHPSSDGMTVRDILQSTLIKKVRSTSINACLLRLSAVFIFVSMC